MSKFSQRQRRATTSERVAPESYPVPVIVGGYPAPDVKITWDSPEPNPVDVEIWRKELSYGWTYTDSIEGWREVWISPDHVQGGHHTLELRIVCNYEGGTSDASNEISYEVMSGP